MKPVKLRAACNSCFSAKVRCDGNKQGCQRCCDKKLNCVYSESRVGKVVGRRRKRPLEGSIGTVGSETWFINQPSTVTTVPSPPASQYSEPSSKRQCSSNSWASFLVDEHQDLADFEDSVEPSSFEMINPSAFCDSNDMSLFYNHGLPTPGMSPPHLRYLSPAALEARPASRSTSITTDGSKRLPPRFSVAVSAPLSRNPEPTQNEDDEFVCVKLLAHLKKHSSQFQQGMQGDQLDLLRKTNASVRQILRNKTVRTDYTCQLLLSGIVTHMVDVCEMSVNRRLENPQDMGSSQAAFESQPGYFDRQQQQSSELIKTLVIEATNLATEVGELLKRKPLHGFQVLGRHESHHIELDLRLQRALARLG